MGSKVFYCDFRTTLRENIPAKFARLLKSAGMTENIDFTNKFTAIKLHFGEPGNLGYLRPQYAKVIADLVKEAGGVPFLTDCNTLYVGGRKNALEHIQAAYMNGFTPYATGCQVIIADGLKGMDDIEVSIDGDYIKNAKIGRAIMDADVFISLAHFKGHENAGFGGTIKNIGMGCGSRAGKMEMHNAGKPKVARSRCIGCGMCLKYCAQDAITVTEKKASIDHEKCVGCGRCIAACNQDAIYAGYDEANEVLNRKMAEYTLAVVKDRPSFYINIVMDVSPNCDCHAENDTPIVPDVGMFASFDPIALDMACADAVNKQPILPGSALAESEHCHHDHFTDIFPETNWMSAIEHGEKIGLGTREYELVRI